MGCKTEIGYDVVQQILSAVLLMLIMTIAPLSGCIGNNDDVETPEINDIFTLNEVRADIAVVVAGEYNEFILEGEGTMITVPEDIMLFVNNSIVPSGMAMVEEDRLCSGCYFQLHTSQMQAVNQHHACKRCQRFISAYQLQMELQL